MDYKILLVVMLAFVVILLFLILLNDLKFGRQARKFRSDVEAELSGYKRQVKKFEDAVTEYRDKYILHHEAAELAHDHLIRATDSLHLLKRRVNILKNRMIQRHEVVLPEGFSKLIVSLKNKMEELDGPTTAKGDGKVRTATGPKRA